MNTAITSEAPANESVTFDTFGLHPDILRALAESGYTRPTPIQAAAIPVVVAGRDVMGAAQTGTGKTAGFSLPIIQNLLPEANTSASPARHPVRALILTPTRELADQVYDNVAKYGKYTALRSAVVFGGVDMNPQTEQLRRGVEILVATPGRLLDHVQQRSVNLSQVRMLVLDEADRMLDMGFLPDLQRIINLLPAHRQTLLFSATFSPEIKKLAASYLRHPQTIEVARSNATADNVRQVIYTVPDGHKQAALVHLLRQRAEQGLPSQCIVFSNSKIGCSRLARALEREGINANAIHGDKTQTERMQTLEAFKQGTVDVLVATDVAARGLDISQMPCVINFDLPFNAEDYVHRIGRTGRAGASGDALSLFAPGDERLLADIEKLIKRNLPRETLTDFDPTGEQARERERRERDERRNRTEIRRSRERDERNGARVLDHTVVRPAFRASEDPFFSRPYESSAPAETAETAKLAQAAGHPRSAKRPIAALLGGVPRKR
ncbi:DEAD/DEAH box helicase [Ralstonia syzygii subsp. celebesensis]|uniref:DEAD-box ATP-dependent RNA helicase RhpA n=2 Tax=Ralstonia syzygii subsp. celebesensis TaxID=1310168 RepID=A0A1U9VFC0_9RALS|nr:MULTISPECIES: DEAD/DEAH box helicase [Ralstonia solanacearum species complex]CAH0443726.1 ATP-dependent RNA helicase RhlE [Ralstonia syzygii subsp. syzygii]CCA79493.1 ATP-dependent RNA helicase, deaD-box family [blood disease bacterium R229]AQW29195.1 DEAD/DEAH box helicase [blood disease bacterium A2-HR MARDI]QQV54267.1 DEAD/DEAH box helicase [Ralstonia syzygii subsp. celebesensis]CBJ50571.1 ATP-dependent RNA helicase, deaD-box family [Ralstonia solanacearum PSI07]